MNIFIWFSSRMEHGAKRIASSLSALRYAILFALCSLRFAFGNAPPSRSQCFKKKTGKAMESA
jgi:hypothetical protein